MSSNVQAPGVAAGEGPGFRRVLSRYDLIVYGLTVITPTAAYAVMGIVQQVSAGHGALSYLLAMVAMLFTAVSYGRMVNAYPSAGSAYTYASKALHGYVGFLAGWAMIIDYVLVPLLSAVYVSITMARLLPSVPYAVWAFIFAAGITWVNIRGIRVTARASEIMTAAMSISALSFVVLSIIYVVATRGFRGLFSFETIFNPAAFAWPSVMLGAGIAALSYLGFDAVSTLAEDSKDPERDIGFATVAVCVIQAGICFLIVYLGALVWPASRPFTNTETAVLDISQVIGGSPMFGFTTIMLLVAAVACSITIQAGASRLLYGMGRDGVLPRRIFGHLDPKTASPVRTLYLIGGLAFVGSLFIDLQTVVELVNFGAFAGFILVNLSVIRHYYLRLGLRSGRQVWTNLVIPALGAIVCGAVWLSLSANAKTLGFAWLILGLLHLGYLTGGFRRPVVQLDIR